MSTVSLKQVYDDLQELKGEIKKLTAIVEEDFELADSVKKELLQARKEKLSQYVDHRDVLKEFSA